MHIAFHYLRTILLIRLSRLPNNKKTIKLYYKVELPKQYSNFYKPWPLHPKHTSTTKSENHYSCEKTP